MFRFEFKPHGSDGETEWFLQSIYRPDQRVADAWKCPLVELDADLPEVSIKKLSATIPDWVENIPRPKGSAEKA